MVLTVKWEEFKNETEAFKSIGNTIIDKYKSSRAENKLENLKEEKQSWEKSIISYVSKSFEPENRILVNEFKAQRGYSTGFN